MWFHESPKLSEQWHSVCVTQRTESQRNSNFFALFPSGRNHLSVESIFWKLSSGLSKRFFAAWRLHKRRSLSKDYNKYEQCCLIESARRAALYLLAKSQMSALSRRRGCHAACLDSIKAQVEARPLAALIKSFLSTQFVCLPFLRMCFDENLQIGFTNSLIYSMFLRNMIRQVYRSAGEVKISISAISVSLNNEATWATRSSTSFFKNYFCHN